MGSRRAPGWNLRGPRGCLALQYAEFRSGVPPPVEYALAGRLAWMAGLRGSVQVGGAAVYGTGKGRGTDAFTLPPPAFRHRPPALALSGVESTVLAPSVLAPKSTPRLSRGRVDGVSLSLSLVLSLSFSSIRGWGGRVDGAAMADSTQH